VLVLVIAACSGSESPSAGDAATGGSLGSGGTGETGATEALTDPQIFKVLETIHESRVAEAQAATARATNQDVVAYAKSVAGAHQGASAALAALEKQRSVTPADSTLSLTLAATSRVEVETLLGVATAEFDRAYLQAQITDQQKTLSAADDLLGMTRDSELKGRLNALKAQATEQRDRAMALLPS
jgi:predicted outer membrane protein